MTTYITIPLETDPDQLADNTFAFLQDNVPGWQPSPAHIETWLIQAIALIAAENRDVASAVPDTIYKTFGSSLLSLPPEAAAAATTTSTWTMVDNAGYVIPAGAQLVLRDADDNPFAFEVVEDVTVPNGSTATTTGQVILQAIDPGPDANGLTNPASLVDSLAFVTAINIVAPTSGGQAEEDDPTYLRRLTTLLQLLAPRPIIPSDFAALARNTPGVFRALALDGYDPVALTTGNERTVAVACVDEAGAPVSAPVKAAVDADLQAKREVNFVVAVFNPTVTQIDATVTAVCLPDRDPTDTEAVISAALAGYLNPATWGAPSAAAGDPDPQQWLNTPVVRYLEIAQIVNEALGVDYITALTIGIASGVQHPTDVTLPGAAPLAAAGTFNVIVTAP